MSAVDWIRRSLPFCLIAAFSDRDNGQSIASRFIYSKRFDYLDPSAAAERLSVLLVSNPTLRRCLSFHSLFELRHNDI